jgi:hypothetical protein
LYLLRHSALNIFLSLHLDTNSRFPDGGLADGTTAGLRLLNRWINNKTWQSAWPAGPSESASGFGFGMRLWKRLPLCALFFYFILFGLFCFILLCFIFIFIFIFFFFLA